MSKEFLPEYMDLLHKAVELNGAKALKYDAIVNKEGHLVDMLTRDKSCTCPIGHF